MEKTIKYLIWFVIVFFVSFNGVAQSQPGDTVMAVDSRSRLVITEKSGYAEIRVTTADGNEVLSTAVSPAGSTYSVKSRQNTFGSNIRRIMRNDDCREGSRWDVTVDGVCVGLTDAVGSNHPGEMQWSKSFELCWLNCLAVIYDMGGSDLSFGLGFDWRNYRSTWSDRMLTATSDKGMEWTAPPDGVRIRFSRLKVFSLQFPVLFRTKIPSTSLHFKAGPIMNFNTYGSLKTGYDDTEGNRCEIFTKAIEPRRFTLDFFASLSLCKAVGIYARYSPMKVMKNVGDINFRPFTLGLTLGI